jgi:hypothetical protein
LSRGMSFAWRFPAMKLLSSVLSMKIVVSTFHKHLLWLTHSQLDWYKHHCNNNRQQAWVISWWAASISGIMTVWWRCEMLFLITIFWGWVKPKRLSCQTVSYEWFNTGTLFLLDSNHVPKQYPGSVKSPLCWLVLVWLLLLLWAGSHLLIISLLSLTFLNSSRYSDTWRNTWIHHAVVQKELKKAIVEMTASTMLGLSIRQQQWQ